MEGPGQEKPGRIDFLMILATIQPTMARMDMVAQVVDPVRTFRQNGNRGAPPIAPRVRRVGGMTSDLFHGLEWTMLRSHNVIPNFTLGQDYLR